MVDVMYGCGSDYDNSEEEWTEVELKAAHDRIIAVSDGKATDLMAEELASSPFFDETEEYDDLEIRFDASPLFDPLVISSSTLTSRLVSPETGGLVNDLNNNNINNDNNSDSNEEFFMTQTETSTTRSRTQSMQFNSQYRMTFVTNNKRTIHRSSSSSNKKSRTASRTNRKTNLFRQDTGEYYTPEFILKEGLKKRKGSIHHMQKPYVCPVPGCGKYYKNPNGIKYHAKYGHSAPQEFPCHCGKMYSTRHGLMAHKKVHGPGWPLFESKNNWKQINKV